VTALLALRSAGRVVVLQQLLRLVDALPGPMVAGQDHHSPGVMMCRERHGLVRLYGAMVPASTRE